MSINDKNNSRLILKNNSTQNLYISNHHKNKSSNLLSDSPSTFISAQIYSSNSNQNSYKKDKHNKEKKIANNVYSNVYSSNDLNYLNNNIEKDNNIIKNKVNYKLSSPIINLNKKDSSNINIIKDTNRSYSSKRPEISQNYTKNINNYEMKMSKGGLNYTVNTPKQISSAYSNMGISPVLEHGNISVKKNIRLGIQNTKNSPSNDRRINSNENKENNNKNDFVEYVNNDKHNFNCNILNMTQNYDKSKYILPQSRSFTRVEKKNSAGGLSPTNTNMYNSNINNKRNHNINFMNYNNYKNNKKKELTVLTKNSNTCRINSQNKYNTHIDSFPKQNISNSPNIQNGAQSYFSNISKNNSIKRKGVLNKTSNTGNGIKSKGSGINKSSNISSVNNINNINNNSSKNIYLMKMSQQRKKASFGKNRDTNTANTNQSSFGSKNKKEFNTKNSLDSSLLSEMFNKNIETPEELHFFYIKMLQKRYEISKKFDSSNVL